MSERYGGDGDGWVDCGDGRRGEPGGFGDDVAEEVELGRGAARLVEGGVVVVAGDVGLVVFAVGVGAVHPAEAGAAVKHVDADGVALRKNPGELVGLLLGVGGVVVFAPVIEPSGPVFAVHERAIGAEFVELCELFLRLAGAEVDDGGQLGKCARGEFVCAVSGVELGFGEAGVEEDVVDLLHVGVVAAEGAVLVFYLDGDDGAARADLEGCKFLAEAEEPAACGRDEFWVGAADDDLP